jgi:hypothetical protein
MLEESGDELLDREGHPAGLLCPRVNVAEGDMLAVERFDALVGDGDAVDVSGEVLGGPLARAGMLQLDGW